MANLVKSSIVAELVLLQPLIAAQIEALCTELQDMVVARLEVIQPLHDMAVALQGWASQVPSLWERLEAFNDRVFSSLAID
ncbi:hypothetical protein D1007_61421 [Hordeum vulgare]|nr:hypothetical protein D1007_61421 [Hordeum vulgare]